ncbi:hypothetical protein [Xanthovirga aplysinae]|uniref:hypothetical protein n=1 Tax=Xanthovirga aplysinae TaxID=2529853 RepID=UPI0012BD3D9B|nr:hypothetical protein [Xanthovirga aplysinae]MTI31460.1 hypothetical protein [Xanthovirga aplysinae]
MKGHRQANNDDELQKKDMLSGSVEQKERYTMRNKNGSMEFPAALKAFLTFAHPCEGKKKKEGKYAN